MNIKFVADKVKIRTGKADGSAEVVFEVGEYALDQIKELVTVKQKNLLVEVSEYKDGKK